MSLVAKCCLSCGAGLPADGLVCAFCGAAHVLSGGAHALACPGCGAGNALTALHCVQCRASLVVTCPECRATSPHGSRYCQACRIEFRAYRRAQVLRAPLAVELEQVEQRVVDWLDGRWFKARDLRAHLRLIDSTLVWLPVWRFRARATGKVQGQVSQTHYRTVTNKRYDADREAFVDEVDSRPYQVWTHVTKDFDRTLDLRLPGAREGEALYDVLELGGVGAARPVGDVPPALRSFERVFDPDLTDLEAFSRLRQQAREGLEGELLERVESIEARWLEPALTLTFQPVWQVVYRYRRAHGDVRVHGSTGAVTGKRVTLLDQWFA